MKCVEDVNSVTDLLSITKYHIITLKRYNTKNQPIGWSNNYIEWELKKNTLIRNSDNQKYSALIKDRFNSHKPIKTND